MEYKPRLLILISIFVFIFFLIILRLADLQILRHGFYEKKSQDQRTRIINLAAQRGDIYDRNGNILATSIDTFSVYINREGWRARKLSLAQAEELRKKDPARAYLLKEKKRIYPKNRIAAQILGFTGLDNRGLSGIELAFDDYLRGQEGRVVTEGDPTGRELYGAFRELEPGSDGMNITLTIDENIQYVAERAIEKQIKTSSALSGMLIVMDAKTGDILALASKPDFDPNNYQTADRKAWHPRVLDPYEPGSTFKLITAAAGLEDGAFTLDTPLKAMDSLSIGGRVIENSHKINWGGSTISISKMLEQSINTGASQISMKLGPERFYKQIKAFGFGTRTDFGLWGESKGIVNHWRNWNTPDIAMMAFGQSIAVTPLQLLRAVSAFAGDGVMVNPILVKKIESNDGQFVKVFTQVTPSRAIKPKIAAEMKQLMRNVVLNGSGRRAQMKWFTVGGKTGTAQKANPRGGYMKGHYIASFIGIAPLTNPRLIGLVIVDDPKGSIWGESVCGPVFKEVLEFSLRYLNEKPDIAIITNKK
ncbi:MAG: penicillin-binding protein 2 [Candidatus Margulisiibacteriota bacterium]